MDSVGKHTMSFTGLAATRRLMSACLLAWLLCASMTSVVGEWTHYCGTQQSARYIAQGRCGSQLAETLSVVCRMFGGYNKRSAPARTAPHRQRADTDAENSPFLSKSKAYAYLQINKRVIVTRNGQAYRQGIVCECCMHKCGLGELYEYCADPAYTVSKRWRAAAPPRPASSRLTPTTRAAHESLAAALLEAGLPAANDTHLDIPSLHAKLVADGRFPADGLGYATGPERVVPREDVLGGVGRGEELGGFGLDRAGLEVVDTGKDMLDRNEVLLVDGLDRVAAAEAGPGRLPQTAGSDNDVEGGNSLLGQILRLSISQKQDREGLDDTEAADRRVRANGK